MIPRPALAASFVVALSLLGDSMLYAVLPSQYDAFGLPVVAVGLLLSANRYVRLVTNSLAGKLYDRVGVRLPFVGALGLGAATTAAYGLAPPLALFVLARMLWGASWSLLRLGGYLTTIHHSQTGRLSFTMGVFHAVSRLGSLVGMLVGGILADSLGARVTLLLFGAVTLVGLPIAWSAALDQVHAPAPRSRDESGKRRFSIASFIHGGNGGWLGRRVAAVRVATLWAGLVSGLVMSSLGLVFRLRFGEQIEVVGLVIGVAALTGVVLSSRWVMDLFVAPLSGILTDRVGNRGAAAGFGMVVVGGLALLAFGGGLGEIVVGTMLTFLGGSALVVVFDSTASRLASPEQRAAAMSQYSTWSDLGSATGPALGYALLGVIGLASTYVLAGLGLLVVMAAFVWAMRPVEVGLPSTAAAEQSGGTLG